MTHVRASVLAFALLLLGGQALLAESAIAAPCDPPVQVIACENTKVGNPPSEWDVSGGGDADIQGFTTDISVDQGGIVRFKVDTPSTDYRLDIYRMGYYAGNGARKITTVQPSAALPQSQPPCQEEASTGLIDCGAWAESASWAVPASAVSGIYFAKLVREDTASGGSHVVFVVRDDDGGSDLLFQTSDSTWQAYNRYGGKSLYAGGPGVNPARAYAVSYNRPLTVRGPVPEDSPFNAEYPMVRWLERNGYDVSYSTDVDSDRRGAELLEHEAFLSVGHDEYWSGQQRANVEAARDAGVHLAFFSGNEIFWKTRWRNSIAGTSTPYRTLVSYKETHANSKIDPEPNVWTGTWRDPRFSPPADGGRQENELSGTAFAVNAGTTEIVVPAEDGRMRFWRNTSVASLESGQTATLGDDTLGYEWDEAPQDETRPAGLIHLSTRTANVSQRLLDYGSTYGSGPVTHHLTLYRAPSDALVFSAGTIQWSWGLDGSHDRGTASPDSRMQQATVNLLADMGAQPKTLQAGLAAATQSADDEAPTATIATPADGGDVELDQPMTISGSAADAASEGGGGGEIGAVEVSVDGGETWEVANGRESWTYSWTPEETGEATVMARAVDDSGNIQAPGDVAEVDVVEGACPCSIWDPSFTGPQDNDKGAIEVGVKFRSDVTGFITGIRFYKTAGNTGTHAGRLWTAAGTPLAVANFSGETATGWQQASFPSPVPINAGTTYIASYHAPNGRYASITGYFSLVGVDNPPLHALANGVDGANGIYKYGSAGGLFTGGAPNSFNSENYLVDVVFEDEILPDTTPPTIASRSPVGGSTDVSTDISVTASFDEPMDPATINGARVELRDPSNNLVSATVSYDVPQRQLTLDPSASLQQATTYTVKVKGGAGGVADLAGNPLAASSTWSFTTVPPPPPPPDEGPGGPIMVISNSGNPFSRYYGEILRAEGLNAFTTTDIANVTPALLGTHDVAILGEGPLSPAQATTLSDWVQAGGNLIAMRPDSDLAGLLGLTSAGGTLGNAYLQVNTGSGPGTGIVGQTIQFHGTADRYTLSGGAQSVATLYSNATTSTSNPAVTLRSVGSSGGQAAAFSYDLARSIVYTRQGNPAWDAQERDGLAPRRSDDLFFGAKAGDVQPDWVDLNKVAIPQADEQQRLLTNLIGSMNLDRKPLPRFWFLPRDEKAAVVMTGDDHAHNGTQGRFEHFKTLDPPGCVVTNWECVRATSYIYPDTPITDSKAGQLAADGFEIALHAWTNCKDWDDQADLEDKYTEQLNSLATTFPSLPAPTTNRTHCIVWSDWATQPKVELENGIRLDTTYYYWPEGWVQNRPGMFTGSGMPMRFADLDGSMIDVYQAATQMTDESAQTYPFTANELLDKALGSEGYYGVFTANIHTDKVNSTEANAIIASAQARGVPVISARQMLTWLDGRNQSSFESIGWAGNKLSFTIDPAEGANGLRAMVPVTSSAGPLNSVVRGATPVATTTQTIKGVEYAFFDAVAGSYTASYEVAPPPSAPTLSSTVPASPANANSPKVVGSAVAGSTVRIYSTSDCSGAPLATGSAAALATGIEVTVADNSTTALRATATNTAGASPCSAPISYVEDSNAPLTQIDSSPPALTASAVATFTFSGSDPGGAGVAFQCRLDSTAPAAWAACTSPRELTSLANGAHTFEVRAIDNAGNADATPASFAWTIDSTAPQTQIDSGPANPISSAVADFTFSGSDPGGSGVASLQCRLDSTAPGAWAACTSPRNLTGFADGSHTFEVRAIDNAGNTDATPAIHTWTVDTVAPNTTIDVAPPALGNSAGASFSFSGQDPGGSGVASFQCRLDSTAPGAWATCASPRALSGLTDGTHTFEVRAVDAAGNTDGTPASFTWSIDTAAPSTTINSSPTILSGSTAAEFAFSGADPGGSGVASFQCRLDSTAPGAWVTCTSPRSLTSLAEGSHAFEVRAIDQAGNADATPASFTWTVDSTAPQTQIDSGPPTLSSGTAADFAFSGADPSGSGVASFQCRLDSTAPGAWAACTSPRNLSGLGQGAHTFEARAIDNAGNVDATPASFSWTVDSVAPNTTIDSNPPTLVNSPAATFAFSGTDAGGSGVASFQCRLDSTAPGAWATCVSPRSLSGLAEGSHSFEVRAIDQAGNTDATPAVYAWTVDSVAPSTQINSSPPTLTAGTAASFSFSGADLGGSGVASFQCRLDSTAPGAWVTCASPRNLTSLTEGAHSFEVRAIDQAGNADATPASFTWTVDSTAPQTQIDSGPTNPAASATANFSFSGTDSSGSGVASFQCRRDSTDPEDWSLCASPRKENSLAEGPHTFEVRSIDNAGNVDPSPATFTWTIDTIAPTPTIDSGPTGLTNDSTPTFAFSAEPGATFECSIDTGTPAFGPCSTAGSHTPASPLADGPRTFRVRATDAAGNQGTATRAFTVDTAAPPAPTLTATVPASPANDNTPQIVGSAQAGTTVRLYANANCSGAPIATTSAAALGAGVEVTVADNSTTSFSATATAASETPSPCSAPRTYVEDSNAPETQITVKPAALVKVATADFTFNGSDPGGSGVASLECRLDSSAPGAWTTCTSPRNLTGLGDGPHTFEVRSIDNAGNADPSPAIHTWTVDTVVPNTTIDSGPAALVKATTATFAFNGTDPGGSGIASVECRLDSTLPAGWAPCASPREYTGLTQGSHTFEVRATDNAGNVDATPATHTWTVDTIAPTPTIDSLSKSLLKAGETSDLTWHANENGTFQLRVGGADCDTGTVIDSGAYGSHPSPKTSNVTAAQLVEGANTLRLCLTDAAGNRAQATAAISRDTGAPDTQITAKPATLVKVATADFTFNGTDAGGSGIASLECRLDSSAPGAWVSCTSPRNLSGFGDGSHTFEVRAIDNAGNVDATPATHAWTVDTIAPTPTIDSGPNGPTSDSTPTFAFSSEPGAGFECSIDTGTPAFGPCSAAGAHTPASPLADGPKVFRVRATDAAGNQSIATRSFTIDATSPETQITAKPAALVKVATADFTFNGSDAGGSGIASLECRLDSTAPGAWVSCTSPRNLSGLADGSHTFEVRAIDNAGNVDSSPAIHTWTVDTAPPAVQVDSGPNGPTSDSTPTFAFSSEPGASFECSIDTGTPAFGPCSAAGSHTPASPLADGPRTFRVRATDAAGNQATATRSFTVDTAAPPAPTLTATVSASPANDNTPQIVGSAPAGTTVRLYANANCSGAPIATTSAAALGAGVEVTVADNSTTSFSATATTVAENTSTCSVSISYLEDSTAPETQITIKPAALVNSATASFAFNGTDPGGSGIASLECRLDSTLPAGWAPCTSPREYTGLTQGSHTFEVRATDNAGNVDATPATHTWTIDTAPPAVQVDSLSKSLLKAGETSDLTWHANENGTFQLRVGGADCDAGTVIDSGAYGSQPSAKTSNVTAAQLVEGANTLRLCLTDAAGNRAQATSTISRDTGTPETQITANPAALVKVATASFTFNGTDPGGSGIASLECRLDSTAPGAWVSCTSPRNLSGLADGSHTFEVRAIDNAGNVDSSPAIHTWTVDTAPPAVQVDSGPNGPTSDSTPTFAFSSEPGASFECSIDTGTPAFGPCSAAGSHTPASPLADGPRTFRVRATDAAGNQATATRSFTVDTAAPPAPTLTATVPASPANDNTPQIVGSAPAGTTIRLYSTADCSGAPIATVSAAALEAGVEVTVADDSTTSFGATSTTAAQNTSGCSAPRSYVEDSTAPETQITANPAALVKVATASFAFNGTDSGGSGIASLECRLDSTLPAGWAPCTSPRNLTGLADGSHTFEVRATDNAGNVDATPATHTWTVDTQGPQTQIDTHPMAISSSATASFTFQGSDPAGSGIASFQCRRDIEDWTTCSSPRNFAALAEGSHSFEVRSIDNAGNVDATAALFEWTIDTHAAETQITAKPAALANSSSANFAFSGTDPGGSGVASLECRLDSTAPEAWTACTSPKTLSGLADGPHTFEVRATDHAGNTDATPSTETWTVDTAIPSTQIDSGPPTLSVSAAASFTFSGADPGGGEVTFQCRLDSTAPGAWTACTSPRNLTGLGDGSHDLEVRAKDQAGNVDQSPATYTWTIDTTAPSVAIDSGPTGLTNDSTPTFAFSSEPGASFECSIDTGTPAFGPCSAAGSHTPASPLAEGPRTFRVRATDAAGNQATATRSFTVDTAAPPAPTLTATVPASPANDNTPQIVGSAPAGTTVRLYANANCSGAPIATGSAAALATGIEVTVADDSTTGFSGTATTGAGNSSSCSAPIAYTEDSNAPSTAIDTNPPALTATAAAVFTFSGADPGGAGVDFQCRLDSTAPGAWVACASPRNLSGLADGAHTFEVRAVDRAGNVDGTAATHTWTVDTAAPDTQITAKPPVLAAAATASFTFAGTDQSSGVASFQCRLDSGAESAWQACASPREYTGLADGPHTFEVRAIDSAGNVDPSAAGYSWSIDTSAPQGQPDAPQTSTPGSGPTPGGSGAVRFLRVKHDPKSGTALLVFDVPGPGFLSARAPELSVREARKGKASAVSVKQLRLWRKSIKPSSTRIAEAGLAEVPIALTAAGKSLLQANRRLKLKVIARFKSESGASTTWKITVTLKKVDSLASGTRG